jgi:hypothetical protein
VCPVVKQYKGVCEALSPPRLSSLKPHFGKEERGRELIVLANEPSWRKTISYLTRAYTCMHFLKPPNPRVIFLKVNRVCT